MQFLLDRMPAANKSNSWVIKIEKICESKLTRLFKGRYEALQAMKVNNESARSVMNNISKIKPRQPIYYSIVVLLKEIDNVGVAKIREMMFNTIQYRDGKFIAITLDAMNGFSTTTKGFGVTSSSNTQVFNPHSAPAIQSPSHAFFFDELPTVYEPFLPEAEPGVYTLVLDLDETLVHYFDLGPDSHFLIRPG